MVKRYVIPGIIAALLAVSLIPAPTYTYVVRELSQTFTALQSFSSGLNVASGVMSVASEVHFALDGQADNNYLTFDPDSGFINVYIDDTLKATITGNGVLPGACGSDLWAMELGTQCNSSACGPVSVGPAGPVCVATGLPAVTP